MIESVDPRYPLAARRMTALGGLVVPDYRLRQCWYHEQIADALDGMIRYVQYEGRQGGYARVVISMPPQEGKSLHGRELLPARALGVNPNWKIIAASYASDIAKEGLTNTRKWMSHDDYKQTFSTRFGKEETVDDEGNTRIVQVADKATMFRTLRPKNPRDLTLGYEPADGYYLAQGIDGSITGRGYHFGIMDDLIKNDIQALSLAYHARLWSFYTSTFATRSVGQFSAQLYIGTRWTDPDFADELVEFWEEGLQGRTDLIKVLRFSAIAEDPMPIGDPRLPGEGLNICPKCKSLNPDCSRCGGRRFRGTKWYESARAGLLKRAPWVWWGLYQQRPQADGLKMFQPDMWLRFDETADLSRFEYIDISIDPNLAETGSSFAVISVTGVLIADARAGADEGEHYFLLDEARGHWNLRDFFAEFERIWEKWHTAFPAAVDRGAVWVEERALGHAMISEYQHGKYNIEAVPKAASKIVCYRLASKVANPERKRVRVPQGTWGHDTTHPTDPYASLVTDKWVGSYTEKGSWVHEMASQNKPDDRRDAFAQQILCRDPSLGRKLLGIRG